MAKPVYPERVTCESVFQITVCRSEDLPAIATLLEESAKAAVWSLDMLRDALASHPEESLLARHEEEIVGFVCGRQVLDEGEILNLVVRPDFRRRGLATALVRRLLDLLAQQSVLRVFLEVRNSNDAAIAFYRALNFGQVAARPNYYRNPTEHALVLALLLPDSLSTAGTH